MKKNLFFAILGLAIVFFVVSCSKSGTTNNPPANTTVEGKWVGTFTSGPSHYFALTFQSNGTLLVEANALPDIANGTWSLAAGDSVRATFTYVSGPGGTYSIAGKYSPGSAIMEGTMGSGTNTTGAGVFSVTKQN